MTTINNSENLIEKVGGIEKAREIAFDPLHSQMSHVSNDGRHWVNEAFAHIPEIQCQIESMIRIHDLRTAIAEHDSREFKVGDLVVCTDIGLEAEYLTVKTITGFIDNWGLVLNDGEHWVNTYRFRHATHEEIKAGHRLDQAPKTCGCDLASGKDWSAEIVLDRGDHE